jgi:peptidoglycan/LPS O-acetylase OafA/YrhL
MTGLRLPGLQVLRALAACMVLVGHVLAEAEHYLGMTLPLSALPWTRGVDVFFVISGFVIALSVMRHAGQPKVFLARRLLRVVPLYYLFTSLMVLALLILPGAVKDTSLDPGQVLGSYAFWPVARDDGRIAPVLSLGWTLNYELFFYAATALCMYHARPLRAVALLLGGIVLVGVMFRPEAAALAFWSNPLVLEFLFGIALARLWQRGHHRPDAGLAAVCAVSGIMLLVLLDPLPLPRFLAAGVPAALLVAGGTLFWPPLRLPDLTLGDASYALYLSHRFALRAATLLLLPLLPATGVGAAAYVTLTILLALALGLLVHHLIERPMMRGLRLRGARRLA